MMVVRCENSTPTALLCRALVSCVGGPCPRGTPDDATAAAVWSSGDPGIVRIGGAGRLEAVAPGDTVVRAEYERMNGWRSVAVFRGTLPMPTFEIGGGITAAGSGPLASRAVDGAVVEVLDGPIAGRKATSGASPAPLPGFSRDVGPGYYKILGVPPGVFRIRVTRNGYLPQEREVTTSAVGGAVANFDLQPGSS